MKSLDHLARLSKVIPGCILLGVFTLICAGASFAQQYSAEQPIGAASQSTPTYLKNAGVDQNLNHSLPLTDHFHDEAGRDTTLGAYFTKQPIVLALVYFKCGSMCPEVLHGAASALAQTGFKAGIDYEVVVASIDPTDTPADAADAKQHFLTMLGASGDTEAARSAVHFLTGPQGSITDLANAIGFHYVRVAGPDGKLNQFAHSSVIMFATPDGRLSKYLSGISYQPRDVRLALIDAGGRRVGTATDLIMLYCTHFNASQGRYTVSVLRLLGIAGMFSVAAVVGMLYLLSRKPKRTLV